MMREQLKQVTLKGRRTTPTLSDFMNSTQSISEGLTELDSKGVPLAYERIHIRSRYHVNFALHHDRQSFRRRAKGQPD